MQKDKTFFFASYSGLRQEETYYRNTAVVPTARERAGDFSQSAHQAARPRDGPAVPGRHHPVRALRPDGARDPEPVHPALEPAEQLLRGQPARPARHGRGDLQAGPLPLPVAPRVALSYFYQNGTDTQPLTPNGNIPWVDRDFKWTQHNVNVADTWTLNPSTINQLRATYTRQFGGRVNNPTTSLGRPRLPLHDPGRSHAPPPDRVRATSRPRRRSRAPTRAATTSALKDTLTLARGNHSFKFGGEVSYEKIVHDTLLDNYGVFAFNGSKTGNAYADFLLGLPATMTQDAPIRKTDNGWYLSLFAQDDWRVHPRVTLNLGAALRPAVPAHRPARPQARLRPGPAVDRVADRARGPALPRRRGHQPRHREDRLQQHRARAWARLGPAAATAAPRCARASASSTAASPATSGTRRRTTSRSRCASRSRPSTRSPIPTATCRAASVPSRSSTTRPARASRCRRRCSDRRSTSSGPTPTR